MQQAPALKQSITLPNGDHFCGFGYVMLYNLVRSIYNAEYHHDFGEDAALDVAMFRMFSASPHPMRSNRRWRKVAAREVIY